MQEGADRTEREEPKEESTIDQLIGSTWKAKAAQDQISSTESKLSSRTARPAPAGAGRARSARLSGRGSPLRRNSIGLSAAPPPNQREDGSRRHRPPRVPAAQPGSAQQVRQTAGLVTWPRPTTRPAEGRGRRPQSRLPALPPHWEAPPSVSGSAAPGPEAAIPRDTRASPIDARGRATRSHFPCPWQRPRPPFHNAMSKPTPPLLPKGADTWQRRGPLGPCWTLPSPDLKRGGGSPPSSIH